MNFLKLVSAYSIIALFGIAVLILSIIIIHLCTKLSQKRKNKTKQKELQFFLLITIVAIVCFELVLLLVISVVVQIVLIDAHALHEDVNWFNGIYYQSFEFLEYGIAILDTAGHLCVILVFIVRFQVTFERNSIFNTQKTLIYILYSCLSILIVVGFVIIVLICINHHNVTQIIIFEIIWEILVDLMCLWILYLFTSRLYRLLKLSVQTHIKSNSKKELLKQIIEATKASITESKTDSVSRSKSGGRKTKSSRKQSKTAPIKSRNYTMTIDGIKIDRPTPSPKNSKPGTPRNDNNEQTEMTEQKLHCHNELTITKTVMTQQRVSDNELEQSDNEQEQHEADHQQEQIENESHPNNKNQSAAMDLIGVMTKMTLLVTLAVIVSILGVIGNIFIEIQEMKYIEKHDIAIEELWADILPVIDILITSLMLYLQFNFTHKIYRFLLKQLDVWFLTNCLKLIECLWKKQLEQNENDEKKASFLVAESTRTKTLEIVTK